MKIPTRTRLSSLMSGAILVAAALGSGAAHATLESRDINNDGTVDAFYDTVLDVSWLANANAAKGTAFDDGGNTNDGLMTFASATSWVSSLNVYGVTDWRLPTTAPINGVAFQTNTSFIGTSDNGTSSASVISVANEMGYNFYKNLELISTCSAASTATNCVFQYGGLVHTGDPAGVGNLAPVNQAPFINVQDNAYWTGTASPNVANGIVSFGYQNGWQWTSLNTQNQALAAWAVHEGDIAAVPEPQSLLLLTAGLVLIAGMRARRRAD